MNRVAVVGLLLALSGAAHAERQAPIELTASAEVAAARALNDGIDRIAGKVTPCVEKGGDPTACQCQNADDLAALRTAFAAAVERHPAWRGRVLSFSNADRSYSWNISMPGLERALAVSCP